MSLALIPIAPAYPVDVPEWCHTAIRIVDPDLFSRCFKEQVKWARPLDRQLVTGRRDYAIFVHPALIWETNASRPSATRAVARMNITGMRSSPITVAPDDQPG
jgi:hypothetical protein